MKKKLKQFVAWMRREKPISTIISILLIIFVKPIRDLIIGIFKCVGWIYAGTITLVIAMLVFAVVVFLAMIIGEKLGVFPKGYVISKLKGNKDDVKGE